MNNIKIKRINAELIKVISTVLNMEAKDEILKHITIIDVDTTSDLSYAKVYFNHLENSSDFIRREVASKINLRLMPKLKFIYDNSLEYGKKIDQKIAQIKAEEKE